MVWFQCEDCGENLKKPKLANHFRICSAYKLSCIDCGEMFSQQAVQTHTQCITEAEKYGPKGEVKAPQNSQSKPDKPKPNSQVDVNVGLSSRPPWFCSLCNTSATSKQALMLHSDGKKHRAKARAFHAAKKQSIQGEEPNEKGVCGNTPKVDLVQVNGATKSVEPKERDESNDPSPLVIGEEENPAKGKRKLESSKAEVNSCDLISGEVIQAGQTAIKENPSKRKKFTQVENHVDKHDESGEASRHKIKWKKLVTSTLKESTDGVMKIKKLQKLVIKALLKTGATEDETQLMDTMMEKVNSSSRFIVDKKNISLASKIK